MWAGLRRAGASLAPRAAAGVAMSGGGAAARQQVRRAGDLPVKPNKFVEEWGTRREHVENEFRWDGRTLSVLAVTCFAVPYAIYKTSIAEFDTADDAAGRPRRTFWGGAPKA